MSLVESRVPRTALTEALTWVVTGLTLGVTAGSALAGAGVDAWGAETAFAVPALSAALAGLLALAGAPRAAPAAARAGSSTPPGRSSPEARVTRRVAAPSGAARRPGKPDAVTTRRLHGSAAVPQPTPARPSRSSSSPR